MNQKNRCLVVDDEKLLLMSFVRFLRDAGYEVDSAEDYETAMGLATRYEYDLYVTDIRLGEGKTGIDLLLFLRSRNIKAPVIMITGQPETETAVKAVQYGAHDYLVKPVLKQALLGAAQKAVAFWMEQQERFALQEQLEAIYNSTDTGLIVFDNDLRATQFNNAARQMCCSQTSCHSYKNNCISIAQEAHEQQACVERRGRRCCVKPDTYINVIARPLRGINGKSIGTLLSIADITAKKQLEEASAPLNSFGNVVGASKCMLDIYNTLKLLAPTDTTCLIYGESGTGKELLAGALHENSARSNGPFIKVNCAALSDELLESELFGHIKGAFTGAVADRVGRFQMADGGTIFLDEIGDISHKMQTRLLRVLQEREFERVGDSKTIKVNVRVIAATHNNLPEKIKAGLFREDLYYRLAVYPVSLPPLRERKDDIPLLTSHIAAELNKSFAREHVEIEDEFITALQKYDWPGNIRELKNIVEQAMVKAIDGVLGPNILPAHIFHSVQCIRGVTDESIKIVLHAAGGNKSRAAKLLGIDRSTLHRRLKN